MTSILDIIFTDFKSDMERVRSLLKLTKLFRDFGGSEPPTTKPGDTEWTAAKNLFDEAKLRRTDLPILSGSMLLYLSGRFEYFVRQVVESVADDISSKTLKYQDLPTSIQKSLKQKTLDIAQSPKKYGHTDASSEALLDSLMLNIMGNGQSLTIKSEVLSITEANMRPLILQDLLKTVGLTDYWREIGKQVNIKIALEKSTDQDASSEAQAKLSDIMEDRNQIAHPTSTTQFPDADKVLKNADFLEILASNTVDLAKIHLATYKAREERQAS